MVFPSLSISPYIMINQKKYIHFIETNICRKAYPSRRKTIEKWTRIVGKGEGDIKVNGDITDLANASVLLYLNCFYYQANLKLINSLKFAYYWKQKKQIHF